MNKAEADRILVRSAELKSEIYAANAEGDWETVKKLGDQYAREVGLPLLLPVPWR